MERTISKRQSLKCKALINANTHLETTTNIVEELRLRTSYRDVVLDVAETSDLTYHDLECLLVMFSKIQKWSKRSKLGIDKDQFVDILHCGFDMTEDRLMDRIFYALNKKHCLKMTTEKWLRGLNFFLTSTFQEKINYCFQVYDIAGEQLIAKQHIFKLIKRFLVSNLSEEDAEIEARELVDILSWKMDADRDGKISLSDFTKAVSKQPLLLEAFGQCLPYRFEVMSFLATFSEGPII